MWRAALALATTCCLWAQGPRDLYLAQCAGCHGREGEGSRGPSLKTPAQQRATDVDSLVAFLRRGVPGTEMPAFAPEAVPDAPLRALAAYVVSLRAGSRDTASGRLGRGADLFRGKGKCTGCHRVNGEGSAAAPDLSDIGRWRDPDELRRAVVEPASAIHDTFANYRWTIGIPDNYLLVEVATKKGERVTGSRLNEDAFSLQLRDGDGRIRSFLKSELAEVHRQWGKSPMPSYRDTFSSAELDELVAYLANLKGLR